MKLHIVNLEDHETKYPTQFSFDVIEHPHIVGGYIRYRWGFLRCDLYDKNGHEVPYRSYGLKLSSEPEGDISFEEAIKILGSHLGIHLKYRKEEF